MKIVSSDAREIIEYSYHFRLAELLPCLCEFSVLQCSPVFSLPILDRKSPADVFRKFRILPYSWSSSILSSVEKATEKIGKKNPSVPFLIF